VSEHDDALECLRAGGVVAAATETFFGLLADATSRAALDCLLLLKPRGTDKGIPLIVPSIEAWRELVGEPPPAAVRLAERFWPGPLTIAVVPAIPLDPRVALDGTVAVRLPGPSAAFDLVRAFKRPLTATSANPPGEPPAVDSSSVRSSFEPDVRAGRLFVVDGTSPLGKPSSVVVVGPSSVLVVREGAIARAEIDAALA
jgi:L-threonylcarbamoyladenylate synthase